MTLLRIEDLHVQFGSGAAAGMAVNGVSLTIAARECVGLVGESGSGKTQLFMAAMGLLPAAAHARGSIRFVDAELLSDPPTALARVRGSKLAMVFQDPMSALTPHLTIGVQLAEVLVQHAQLSWRDATSAARRALERVRVPEAARRLRQYPHELSGGMRQRVMIGMSLLCDPALVIADEPTTALDVTVQAQIIDLLRELRAESATALALISHDVGVVAGLADRIVVMYAGRIVESGPTANVLGQAQHPYTRGLLDCVPHLGGERRARMATLAGTAPGAATQVAGCAFAPRCARAVARCQVERPLLESRGGVQQVACHFPQPA